MTDIFEEPDAAQMRVEVTRIAYIVRDLWIEIIPHAEAVQRRMSELPAIDPEVQQAMSVAVNTMREVCSRLNEQALHAAREGAEREIREITGIGQTSPTTPAEPVASAAPASSDRPASAAPSPKRRRSDSRLNGSGTPV